MKEYNTTVSENGRIVLPAVLRKKLDIKAGDDVVLTLSQNNEIVVHSRKQYLHKLQNLVKSKTKGKKKLTTALFEMRRKDAISTNHK